MKGLFEHRCVLVLGKGGVGRTTVAAALGIAGAARGLRTCVAEFGDGAVAEVLGLEGRSFRFREGAGGTHAWSLTVSECLDDFGARKLRLPFVARGLLHNRAVNLFVDAVPGLNDLLLLGKIENLVREPHRDDPVFDTVVVDAPATGHGITLLQAASTMTEIAKTGPFHDLSARIGDFLDDPDETAIVLVTLPEELPVSETIELAQALAAQGHHPHTVVVNRTDLLELPDPPGLPKIREVLTALPDGAALLALVEARQARSARQQDAAADLSAALPGTRIVTAPRVPGPERAVRLAESLASVIA